MFKIVMINNKGGVAKTTTTLTLSAFLAERGFKVLAIDMDPQANLTVGFGCSPLNGVGRLMKEGAFLSDVVTDITQNLHLLPASQDLLETARDLDRTSMRPYEMLSLRYQRATEGMKTPYDFILLDTQAEVSGFLALNALAFADWVIIPTQAADFSVRGIVPMLGTIRRVTHGDMLNPGLGLLRVLVTFYEHTVTCKQYKAELEAICKDRIRLFESVIRKNAALERSVGSGWAIRDRNATGFWDYNGLLDEMLAIFKVTDYVETA